jgi:hypothetical protein
MSILTAILTPSFLLNNISLIAEITAVMILVIFDDYISGKLIFPFVDNIKQFVFTKAKEKVSTRYHFVAKYSAEFLATALFVIYFMFGYYILSEYVFAPIMRRLQSILLIVVLVTFFLLSWVFNNKKMRKRYLYD